MACGGVRRSFFFCWCGRQTASLSATLVLYTANGGAPRYDASWTKKHGGMGAVGKRLRIPNDVAERHGAAGVSWGYER